MDIHNFGKNEQGKDIHLITVSNSSGMTMKLTDMGASVVSLYVPDKTGESIDILLGHKSGECYEKYNLDALGTIIGRNANRISGHSFVINNIRYDLYDNCNGMNIHSGPYYYGARLWDFEEVEDELGSGISFSLFSPDNDQGMPGNLKISVTYILTEDNSLMIKYEGICDKDTLINMTNHSYFNLNGLTSENIENHKLYVNADRILVTDSGDYKDLKFLEVHNTPFDFRKEKYISEALGSDYEAIRRHKGIDHNFCINEYNGEVNHVATLSSEKTGITLRVYTDRPGIQVYTANYMNNKYTTKDNIPYVNRWGIALETQMYPDAINHPEFYSPVVKAEEPFESSTIYSFSIEE